jgi:hypothetical protein
MSRKASGDLMTEPRTLHDFRYFSDGRIGKNSLRNTDWRILRDVVPRDFGLPPDSPLIAFSI